MYLYLNENDLLFGFQKGHSTNYAIVQIADQIHDNNKNIYTLDAFLDLSKAFNTDHKILLKKLSNNGIKNKNLNWFTCYLSNKKQFIGFNVNSKTTLLDMYVECQRDPLLGPCYFYII